MKAVCWFGRHEVRVETVPDPQIINPKDAVIRVTATSIGGADLHIYDGLIPHVEKGDILGREFMGEIVEVGERVSKRRIGEKVAVPSIIACGVCVFCRQKRWALCENSNPGAPLAEKMYGYAGAGVFGFSRIFGGYAGGQAEYVRVPFADVGLFPIPEDVPDEKVLFLSDALPAGFMAAENCAIRRGDVVAVWGCGPVGQFAVRSAFLLGAERVIAIDPDPVRRHLAEEFGGAEPLDPLAVEDIVEELRERTGGFGPDACIDAVGMEAHGPWADRLKQAVHLESDRPAVLRQAIRACRKGGIVSACGTYSGSVDGFPAGSVFVKGITLRMGQPHVHAYLSPLMERILVGDIDPSRIISHRLRLEEAPGAYRLFGSREKKALKVLLTP